ncbi:hypothetical protein OSTOST_10226, partial [Ostertagia ostertagi]
LLRFKAVLEASSIDVPVEEREQFTKAPLKGFFSAFLSNEGLNKVMSMFRAFDNGIFADKADQLEKILPELTDFDWMDNLADDLGMERVLCQGDFQPNNILWKQNGDELELAAVVDYQ